MYISLHNHTAIGSNTRGFLDSINKVEDMVNYAKELGMPGLAITDHDSLTAHIDLFHCVKQLKENNPEVWKDFLPICGNEIYLTSRQKIEVEKDYSTLYHFILIAKDLEGYQQLRELSTIAWCDNFFTYVNPRTPTYFDDLFNRLESNPGHLIGSTACLGGQLDRLILRDHGVNNFNYPDAEKFASVLNKKFGQGNFFLEMQPSKQESQIIVNKAILKLSEKLNIPYIITTDAHYLKKEDRETHKAFLLSDNDGGAREVDEFYESTYFMSEDEIHEYMDEYLGKENVQKGLDNTLLIYNQCTEYTLDKPLDIPYKAFDTTEPSKELYEKYINKIPLLEYFFKSEHDCDRHMCREILNKLEERPEEFQNQETYNALHDCLNALITSSEAQHTQWSGYLLVCKELIKTVWESNSLCGPGRGSGVGFFLLYMLDITQVNPLREDTPTFYWRFLHEKRASVLDIDFDSEGSKKDLIIENLRKKYGGYLHVTKVQTISTAKSKKALQIAARALGYTAEEGVYLGSFIQAERGMLYTLAQTYYGDPDNDIAPNTEFKNLMDNKYSDVWDIAQKIEGLPVGCGSHAGGVILSTKPLSDSCSLMRTRSGDIITSVDLHRAEDMGLIKYDVLNIDALEKIHNELDLLLEDGLIEWQGDLKSTYEKYLGVYNIERDNPEIWDLINQHKIISLFQWEKDSGWNCIEKGKPRNLLELTALNSVMRLMPQPGQTETPLDIYSRHMKDINTWYQEMDTFGLTKAEQEIVKKYALESYGLLPSQESFMIIIQDENLGGWDLIFADKLRKAVAKKKPKDFMELEKQFFERVKERNLSEKLCTYVWNLISMNKGYSFNNSHVLAYSIVALQEANLAYHFPMVYWNCSVLCSDAGGEESNVRYGKIAAAVSRVRHEGVTITPPYINDARFGFKPDAENNRIIYGLKAVNGVGATQANCIVQNQPYTSLEDFYTKMNNCKTQDSSLTFGDKAMIQLIKSGAFDKIESNLTRQQLMQQFLINHKVKSLNKLGVKNLDELKQLNLLTPEQLAIEYRYFRFKKYIYSKDPVKKSGKSPATYFYKIEPGISQEFFNLHFISEMEVNKDYIDDPDYGLIVKRGSLDKVIDKMTSSFQEEVFNNPDIIKKVNEIKLQQIWEEECPGSEERWEMESLNVYNGKHELADVNFGNYSIIDFNTLNEEPNVIIEYNGKAARYQLSRIAGTVLDKDTNHNTVTLLTTTGVVNVKMYKGQFGFYAREITVKDEEGTKHTLENSWFKRGTILTVTGFRSGENFIAKSYKNSAFKYSVQKVLKVNSDGSLDLQLERVSEGNEEVNE